MSSEELPADIEASRGLAAELSTVNELEAAGEAKVDAEIERLKLPGKGVISKLAHTAWQECWVDTPATKLLWEARQGGLSNVYSVEVSAAYRYAGDAAEGQMLIDKMSSSSLAKVEALCRFGLITVGSETYVEGEYLKNARALVELLPRGAMMNGYSRLAVTGGEQQDFENWTNLAAVSENDPRKCIESLLSVAAQGYLPALQTAKSVTLRNYKSARELAGNNPSNIGYQATVLQKYNQAIAKAATIERMMQLQEIDVIEGPSVRLTKEKEAAFAELVSQPNVIQLLKDGVSVPKPLSELEQEVLRNWEGLADDTILTSPEQLWLYAAHRVEYFRWRFQEKQESVADVKKASQDGEFIGIINLPDRDVPKSYLDGTALVIESELYYEKGKPSPYPNLPWGHIPYTEEQQERIRNRYRDEDDETTKKMRHGLVELDRPLIYRALFYHISGADKVDNYL